MNIEKEEKIEEAIEDLKVHKEHNEKIIKIYKNEIDMMDFIISELGSVLTKD